MGKLRKKAIKKLKKSNKQSSINSTEDNFWLDKKKFDNLTALEQQDLMEEGENDYETDGSDQEAY